jgi:hypothetical protein
MSLTKLSLTGNNLIFNNLINPGQESLVRDVPVGDGKIANLFLQCNIQTEGKNPMFSTGPLEAKKGFFK